MPLTFTTFTHPFHRVANTVRFIHRLRVDYTFLTAPWIGIGNVIGDLRILRQLLFSHDDTVFGEDLEGTVAMTVHAVCGVARDIVFIFMAVDIFPASVRVVGAECVLDRLKRSQ